jgi:hypothetical protein
MKNQERNIQTRLLCPKKSTCAIPALCEGTRKSILALSYPRFGAGIPAGVLVGKPTRTRSREQKNYEKIHSINAVIIRCKNSKKKGKREAYTLSE